MVGSLGLLAGGAAGAFGVAALAGVVLVGVGLRVREGSRQAIIAAAVLLGLLLAAQLVQLGLDPGAQLVARALLTGAVGLLVLRALRGA